MTAPQLSDGEDPPVAEWVRATEQAQVQFQWVPATRAHVRKRVVTEIQTIEVEIRREELVITTDPVAPEDATPFAVGQAPVPADPLVFALHTEVPTIGLMVQPYEHVEISTVVQEEQLPLRVALRSEHIQIDHTSSGPAPSDTKAARPGPLTEPARPDEDLV